MARIRAVFPVLLFTCLVVSFPAAPSPPFDGHYDYERETELGLNSSSHTVVAPWLVVPKVDEGGNLNFFEAVSNNSVPFNVSVYPASEYSATNATAFSPLFRAFWVTRFMFAFSTLEVETTPAENRTNDTEIQAGLSRFETNATTTDWMIVLERRPVDNRTLDAAIVFVRIDRAAPAAQTPPPAESPTIEVLTENAPTIVGVGLVVAAAALAVGTDVGVLALAAIAGAAFGRTSAGRPPDEFLLGRVYQVVSAEPGVPFSEIRNELGLRTAAAFNLLHELQRRDLIREERHGTRVRYFAHDHPTDAEPYFLDRRDRDIVRAIGSSGGVTLSAVATELGLSESAASKRVSRLKETGIVVAEPTGRGNEHRLRLRERPASSGAPQDQADRGGAHAP